ncbi:hypothetical protein, partial [Corynebacterium matruchotii]|uniref:hypothetical protein n=1 Tax=Corynebacterium matruchotii TaxID=43768 RepID=UPI0028EAABF2
FFYQGKGKHPSKKPTTLQTSQFLRKSSLEEVRTWLKALIVDALSPTSQETWGSWGALGGFWSLDKALQVGLHWC